MLTFESTDNSIVWPTVLKYEDSAVATCLHACSARIRNIYVCLILLGQSVQRKCDHSGCNEIVFHWSSLETSWKPFSFMIIITTDLIWLFSTLILSLMLCCQRQRGENNLGKFLCSPESPRMGVRVKRKKNTKEKRKTNPIFFHCTVIFRKQRVPQQNVAQDPQKG